MAVIDERPLFVTRKVFLQRLARRLAASALAMAALHVLSQFETSEEPTRLSATAVLVERAAATGETAPESAANGATQPSISVEYTKWAP